jgi:uncharacterized protein involved in cysteine biosynthesis
MKANNLLRQYNLGKWLGFSYSQTFNTMAYINIFMAGINLLTFWHTTMIQTRPEWLDWLSLPIFVGFILLVFGVVGFLDYKMVMPARVAFSNRQFFRHDNPLLAELQEIKRIQQELLDRQKQLEAKIGK